MNSWISRAVVGAIAAFGLQAAAQGAAVIPFANGDTFDNDAVGGTAGPFPDVVTGFSGTITTTGISPNGVINTTSGNLGISSTTTGTSFGSSFDSGESWSFSLSVPSQLTVIDFASYSTATENPGFSLQSAAFVGKSFTPGSANVTFVNGTGTVTFLDGTSTDTFSASDLYGAATPTIVPAGTSFTIAYTSTLPATDFATLDGLTFNLVPEPTSLLAGAAVAGVIGIRRRAR